MNKELIDLIDYLESGYDTYSHEAAKLMLKQHAAIVRLRKELKIAITLNECDMVMTGDETRHARKVLEDTKEFE